MLMIPFDQWALMTVWPFTLNLPRLLSKAFLFCNQSIISFNYFGNVFLFKHPMGKKSSCVHTELVLAQKMVNNFRLIEWIPCHTEECWFSFMTCLYKAGTDPINKIAHWQLAPLRQIKLMHQMSVSLFFWKLALMIRNFAKLTTFTRLILMFLSTTFI